METGALGRGYKYMSSIEEVVRKILERQANIPDTRGLLVGVSGIDGCGKGYMAAQLQAHLALHGVIPAILNVDGWLNLFVSNSTSASHRSRTRRAFTGKHDCGL